MQQPRSLSDVRTVVRASLGCVERLLHGKALDTRLTPEQRGRAAGVYKALARVGWWLKAFSTEWDTVDLIFDKLAVDGPSSIPVFARKPLLTASNSGLGAWEFGAPAESVLAEMTEWFGEADVDTGWTTLSRIPGYDEWFLDGEDPISDSWAYQEHRAVCWQTLCADFGGSNESDRAFRGWELATFRAWDGVIVTRDGGRYEPAVALEQSGIELGDTWADFRAAYPTAVPGQAEGNALVIDNPPWPGIFDGVWGWRLDGQWERDGYAPEDAEMTRMSGGEGPEPGCC